MRHCEGVLEDRTAEGVKTNKYRQEFSPSATGLRVMVRLAGTGEKETQADCPEHHSRHQKPKAYQAYFPDISYYVLIQYLYCTKG
jgi:hypothetical protein